MLHAMEAAQEDSHLRCVQAKTAIAELAESVLCHAGSSAAVSSPGRYRSGIGSRMSERSAFCLLPGAYLTIAFLPADENGQLARAKCCSAFCGLRRSGFFDYAHP